MQGKLSVERMCALSAVNRAGFYRSLHEREPNLEEMELRSAIQTVVIEHKLRYGYRLVAAELRHRGFVANHKRVIRLMRLDNLLALRRSAFVATTDSDHELLVHLNLARRMQLSSINQLWLAEITFVRLQQEFVYVGNCAGRLFSQGGWLGAGSIPGRATCRHCLAERDRQSHAQTRTRTSFGPRDPIRLVRIRQGSGQVPDHRSSGWSPPEPDSASPASLILKCGRISRKKK
jgi:hypothetical protein